MILTLSPNIPIKGVFQVDELLGGLKRTPRMCVTIASTRYDQKVDGKLSYLQLRTAPQSSDQSFGGFKLNSPYAPSEGCELTFFRIGADDQYEYRYRYDGLYTVEKVRSYAPFIMLYLSAFAQAWTEPGLNDGGFLVCKFIFQVSSEGF